MLRLLPLFAMVLLAGCGPGAPDEETFGPLPPIPSFNADTTDPSFEPFPQNDKVVTLPSGLKMLDVEVGPEQGKIAKIGDRVRVHYAGWMENGKRFDFSWKRGSEPTTFTLNEGGLIKGWVEGIPGLREGGYRRLWVPADLAYGEAGQAGAGIPPNSSLVFDVWMFEVLK